MKTGLKPGKSNSSIFIDDIIVENPCKTNSGFVTRFNSFGKSNRPVAMQLDVAETNGKGGGFNLDLHAERLRRRIDSLVVSRKTGSCTAVGCMKV